MSQPSDAADLTALADRLCTAHDQGLAAWRPVVDEPIATRSIDVDAIERALDGLFTFCGDDRVVALFRRLCRHYWDIDPVATARHVHMYRDLYDPPDGE